MQVQLIDGAIVISGLDAQQKGLSPQDFSDKPLTVETAPAFYVALDANGLMVRSVSVTAADRKVVAALVGNWIAEGFQPVPCDIKAYAKHVRALASAEKSKTVVAGEPAATAETAEATPAAAAAAEATTAAAQAPAAESDI